MEQHLMVIVMMIVQELDIKPMDEKRSALI